MYISHIKIVGPALPLPWQKVSRADTVLCTSWLLVRMKVPDCTEIAFRIRALKGSKSSKGFKKNLKRIQNRF